MHERTGNVTVERFLEEISPFLDMEPSDPNAGAVTSSPKTSDRETAHMTARIMYFCVAPGSHTHAAAPGTAATSRAQTNCAWVASS